MKKSTKFLICVAVIVIAVFIVIGVLNARIPMPTEGEITAAVLRAYGSEIEEIREACGLSDLTLVLEFDSLEIEKATIFKDGSINAKVRDYFVCSDLDSIQYTAETHDKYSTVLYSYIRGTHTPWAHSFNGTELEGYDPVFVSRVPEHFTLLMDSNENTYAFPTDLFTNTIEKNGVAVASIDTGYTGPGLYSNDGSTYDDNGRKKCTWCNGTGAVKYNYGSSDLQAVLEGHEASWYGQCGSCGGTGYSD